VNSRASRKGRSAYFMDEDLDQGSLREEAARSGGATALLAPKSIETKAAFGG